ncbi:hypothetical protein GQX73_g4795 [Xylaria multiplex]|uniref:Extracellular membrane protein CFEM domain-containing protein n=1 Tax=Xylaria multiplex TaxID=323545 RepID=A0A7C8ITL2_9PEZI|nr:hypothetical protein GQX73_g4795 [Xylaria multiplex]
MRTSLLLNVAVTIGLVLAYDSCLTYSSWYDCVATRRETATSECAAIATIPLSQAYSIISFCNCNGFEINYSCAKTYCPDHTSFQSEILGEYSRCTSFASNPFGVPTTTTTTEDVAQTSAELSSSSSLIPASTTASSASSTAPIIDTTSAPGTTASVETSQPSSTTSAAASFRVSSNGVLGLLLALQAVIAVSMSL